MTTNQFTKLLNDVFQELPIQTPSDQEQITKLKQQIKRLQAKNKLLRAENKKLKNTK
jgi:regulator of replication initiation timing